MRSVFSLPAILALAAPALTAPIDFNRDIRPILSNHCYKCHGPATRKANLRLDLRDAALKAEAFVPGKSADSLLIERITAADDQRMPPAEDGPRLTAEQVAKLKAWIDSGAEYAPHWAYIAPKAADPPTVRDPGRVRSPIDRFIAARLDAAGLASAPEADRATLLRRVSLDLTGLPPSPAEMDAFVNDPSADAYERVVERLLASPAYGERQARHWLDLARYADSNGYTIDGPRSIWPWRDWVIGAFNRDLPFDQFTIEQLAGDLLPNAGTEQLVATGFHRNTPLNQEGGTDPEQFRVERTVDRTNTTGAVWLGLTVGCAQCHDHKYDAVSQTEYFRLYAFFNNCSEPPLEVVPNTERPRREAIRAQLAVLQKELAAYEKQLLAKLASWEAGLTVEARTALPKLVQTILDVPEAKRTAAQKKQVQDAFLAGDPGHAARKSVIDAVQKHLPAVPTTLVMGSANRPTHIQIRGDFLRLGDKVEPGTFASLPPLDVTGRQADRLDLAKWLTRSDHPLTARVVVNRAWQQFFGRGLVETENDFGMQGEPPTHPELLDWLAVEFVRGGWSLKRLHRRIVTSATYRQSSALRPEHVRCDPNNKLLARQNRLRLEAEVIRDSALLASGLLSRRMGGPGVYPPMPRELFLFTQSNQGWPESTGPDRYRRGLYTHLWRQSQHPLLTTFDAPDAQTACTRRNRSNTPLQALHLANDPVFVELAEGLGQRVQREGPADDAGRLGLMVRLVLGRSPTAAEIERLSGFLTSQKAAGTDAAWTRTARVLLNLDEFVTRE